MIEEKKTESEEASSEVWNVSKSYVQQMVLNQIQEIQKFYTLAQFGFNSLEADLQMMGNTNLRNQARLSSLKRLLHAIRTLIRNIKFLLKKPDKKTFEDYLKRLEKMETNSWKLQEVKKRGNKIIELNINEKIFNLMFTEIDNILDVIMDSANKIGLIFPIGETTDPKKIKEGLNQQFLART